jgi:hypothetical protein
VLLVLGVAVGFAVLGQAAEELSGLAATVDQGASRLMIFEELSELYFALGVLCAAGMGWRQQRRSTP